MQAGNYAGLTRSQLDNKLHGLIKDNKTNKIIVECEYTIYIDIV